MRSRRGQREQGGNVLGFGGSGCLVMLAATIALLFLARQAPLDKPVAAPPPPLPAGPAPYQSQYDQLITAAAGQHAVDANLMRALLHWESNYNSAAVSPAGAQGIGQLMPRTAANLGVTDPFDPSQNIDGSTRLMAHLLAKYPGQLELALAGYNAGELAVDQYNAVPPFDETERFVRGVTALYRAYQAAGF